MSRITATRANSGHDGSFRPAALFKGLIVSYIITIPAFMVFALILANVDFPQRLLTPSVVVVTIAGALTAGFVSTKGVRSRGWLNGGLAGLIYMLVLYLASSVAFRDFTVNKYVAMMAAVGVLTGAIGGIAGINARRAAR